MGENRQRLGEVGLRSFPTGSESRIRPRRVGAPFGPALTSLMASSRRPPFAKRALGRQDKQDDAREDGEEGFIARKDPRAMGQRSPRESCGGAAVLAEPE